MLVSKNLKFALPLTRNPKANKWNVGCDGSQMQISHIGHVDLFFFCVNFICVGSRFLKEYGL